VGSVVQRFAALASYSATCICRLDTLTIADSNFTSNTATGLGGGTETGFGGGLYMTDNQQQTIIGSTFSANIARSKFRISVGKVFTMMSFA
jgi:hypothetical protein